MTNVVTMTSETVTARLARWLRGVALVACIGQRMAALFTRRVCAAKWCSVRALLPVRQQLLDPAIQLRWPAPANVDEDPGNEEHARALLAVWPSIGSHYG